MTYLVSTSPWLLDVEEHEGEGGAVLIEEDLSTIVPILDIFRREQKQKLISNSTNTCFC